MNIMNSKLSFAEHGAQIDPTANLIANFGNDTGAGDER